MKLAVLANALLISSAAAATKYRVATWEVPRYENAPGPDGLEDEMGMEIPNPYAGLDWSNGFTVINLDKATLPEDFQPQTPGKCIFATSQVGSRTGLWTTETGTASFKYLYFSCGIIDEELNEVVPIECSVNFSSNGDEYSDVVTAPATGKMTKYALGFNEIYTLKFAIVSAEGTDEQLEKVSLFIDNIDFKLD